MKAGGVACWNCIGNGRGFPCRPGGPDTAVEPHVVAANHIGAMDENGRYGDHRPWSFECTFVVARGDPDLAWAIVLACLPLLCTSRQAAHFAAGLPEDLVRLHGEAVIDRIEALARESSRFRFVLSGIWPQRRPRTDPIWQRLVRARTPGPSIDAGDPLPPA